MNYSKKEIKLIKRIASEYVENFGWKLLIGNQGNYMSLSYNAEDLFTSSMFTRTDDGFIVPPSNTRDIPFKAQQRYYDYKLDSVDELIKIIAIFEHVEDKLNLSSIPYGYRYDFHNFIIDHYLIPLEKAKKTLAEDCLEEDIKTLFIDYRNEKFQAQNVQ